MIKTNTVNISFPKVLLGELDDMARQEARSRSELLREAVRLYLERKNRWDRIFQKAGERVSAVKLQEKEIESEIREYRRSLKGEK
jgi:CopG family transcriptional regulator / antitoxin EndoAI